MAKKMTKAQSRKMLLDARAKIAKVYLADYIPWSNKERREMYDMCTYLGRAAHGPRLK